MSDHVFARVPKADIPRSVMPLSHNLKTTLGPDYLYPIFVGEALPGDVWKFKHQLFGRMTTPLTPLMDNLYLDTFYFAVPVRLVDDTFKRLMGERPYGDIRNDYTTPMLNTGNDGIGVGTLYDYLGIPPGVPNVDFLAWYPRAYSLVWNEFFRDENLVPGAPVAGVAEDGTVTTEALSDYVLRKRGKRHDYFTSCLPWPQKGDPVRTPLGTSAPVVGHSSIGFESWNGSTKTDVTAGHTYFGGGFVNLLTFQSPYTSDATLGTGAVALSSDPLKSGVTADLTNATSATVNQLREAFAIQHLCEQWARGGSRYVEILRASFNVESPDARLQRPEYLGGSSQRLDITTVAQTSASTQSSALGNLASFVTMTNDAYWLKSFTEHTIILGLCNIRADLSYQQGLHRMFSRRTKFDFFWPALASLGEQAVLNKELFCQGKSVVDSDTGAIVDDEPFGYQERWAEYRYMPNRITGKMRSQAAQSLDVWHLAQKFDALPTLGQTFIEEAVPVDRVVAVTDEPPFILDGWFDIQAARPMPIYSVPGLRRL